MKRMKMTKPTHKPKEHKNTKRILDVVPPGKAMANPTSRPVITGHDAPVADDQFVPKTTEPAARSMANDPTEKRDLLDPKQKVQVAPITDKLTAAPMQSTTAPVSAGDTRQSAPVLDASGSSATAVPVQVQTAPAVTEAATQQAAVAAEPASAPVVTAFPSQSVDALPTAQPQMSTEEHKPTPEHLAVEQVVAEPTETPSQTSAAPAVGKPAATTWQLPEEERHTPVQGHHSAKTIDELLAETGAPNLEPEQAPPKQLIVSHHGGGTGHSAVKWLVAIVLVIIFAVVAVDVLLDAGTITTDMNIPHTNFVN
jgi:hypothetical protein